MEEILIAPCGMNCNICSSYLAYKNKAKEKGIKLSYCTGCRPRNKQCAFLKKKCLSGLLLAGKVNYCYECPDFPCERLSHLDKRYVINYNESFIKNLEYIREHGISRFLLREQEKWKCPQCGGIVSCHNSICYNCGLNRLADNKANIYGKIKTRDKSKL
jgi:hypothetical protein